MHAGVLPNAALRRPPLTPALGWSIFADNCAGGWRLTGPRTDAGGLFAAAEAWVILAASTLITACYKQNFSTIALLQGPVRCSGQVQGTLATIDLPAWF